MANNDTKLKSIKSEIRSLLISCPIGMSVQSFLNDYKECIGCPLPFNELGFKSAIGFFKSLTDVVKVKETSNGTLLIPIESKNSSHINNLVSKQRSGKPKRSSRNRHSRARTVKQGNHTYHQSIRPRTNMHFEISMDQDNFDSDELDHLDIVWTKDSPSEEDDLIFGESKNNVYRKVSPPTVSCPQRNKSPSPSSFNTSSDEETDYELSFKEPKHSTLIKKPSLYSTDCIQYSADEENTSKSNSDSIFSAGTSLYHDLKESCSSKSSNIYSPTNFKRFTTAKCDIPESISLSDTLKKEHPVLSHSSALKNDEASNQEKQSDGKFNKTSPTDYDFTETKSRNLEEKVQYDDTQFSTIKQNSMENSFSSSNLRSLADTEKILKPDFSKNILGRPSSSMTHECDETTVLSPKFTEKEDYHPMLRRSVLFSHDSNENEHFSDKLAKKLDNDCTLRRPTSSGDDFNETKSSLDYTDVTEATIQPNSMENSFSSAYSEKTVKSNCDSAFRQLTSYQRDPVENISSLVDKKKIMKPDFFKNIQERPSSPKEYDCHETNRLSPKFPEQTVNSNCHPALRRSILFSYEDEDFSDKNVKFDNDCTLRSTPSNHDYNDIKSSVDYTEEAASVLRRPSSKLHSSSSSNVTSNKSDIFRRHTPPDYYSEAKSSVDYTEETEADSGFRRIPSSNSELKSSTSNVSSKKSDSHPYYKQSSSDYFGKKMIAEDHPALNRLSVDENDSTSYNTASSVGHKISKSNHSCDEEQVEKNRVVDVSEDHDFYLWALVNGVILDEAKIKEPCCHLINLTKKSNKFSKKDLETNTSLEDDKICDKSNQLDHCQIIDYKIDKESNRFDTKVNDYILSVKKNMCINCESKLSKCVCSEGNSKLKNEVEFKKNICDCFKYSSKYDKPLSSSNKFSGMGRGELFKEKLINEKRLGLNDNNPLVNLNVGRGLVIKKLLKTNPINDMRKTTPDFVGGRGYFLKSLRKSV